MSRLFVVWLLLVLSASLGPTRTALAQGQSPARHSAKAVNQPGLPRLPRAQEIELALGAAPAHLREQATVYVFGARGYERVRTGTNGFTCLVNRDGVQHGDSTLHPTCWDPEGSATILPVVLRVGELLAKARPPRKSSATLRRASRQGVFAVPAKAASPTCWAAT